MQDPKPDPALLKAIREIRATLLALNKEKIDPAIITSAALDNALRYIVAEHGRDHAVRTCQMCIRQIENGMFDPPVGGDEPN